MVQPVLSTEYVTSYLYNFHSKSFQCEPTQDLQIQYKTYVKGHAFLHSIFVSVWLSLNLLAAFYRHLIWFKQTLQMETTRLY